MDVLKPFRNFFSQPKETDITRRNFLLGASAVTGLVVASRVFPFRTYSFAPQLHSLSVPGSLFKVGDRFSTPTGVIYEVTGIGESDHTVDALRYSVPLTVINEYDFRNQSKLISRVDELYGFGYVDPKADWTEPSTIRQRLMMDSRLKNFKASLHDIHLRGINVNRDIHGERKFELERNGSVNKIITRFYQGEEHNEPS